MSVLRRHVPDDTYRFPPATDFTGRNVYRASLLRLENLERVHEDELRAGHMDGAIAFAKGRALERLRAYDLAAQHYRAAADLEGGAVRADALQSAAICEAIFAATRIGIDLDDPMANPADHPRPSLDSNAVMSDLDERVSLLSSLGERQIDTHYAVIARQEIERADVTRANYFVSLRQVLPDGQVRAVSELQRVVSRHAASQHRRRHVLRLANLYAQLAEEYVVALPPESLAFDPPRFQELVDAAAQLYQIVASEDGSPEKLEASRRLEAFLAFTLQVDRDRFTR